jgi:hypothetical protein
MAPCRYASGSLRVPHKILWTSEATERGRHTAWIKRWLVERQVGIIYFLLSNTSDVTGGISPSPSDRSLSQV